MGPRKFRFSVRQMIAATLVAAVSMALMTDIWRAWSRDDCDRRQQAALEMARLEQLAGDEASRGGDAAKAAKAAATAEVYRAMARDFAETKGRLGPAGWAGDRFVRLLRRGMMAPPGPLEAGGVLAALGMAALLARRRGH